MRLRAGRAGLGQLALAQVGGALRAGRLLSGARPAVARPLGGVEGKGAGLAELRDTAHAEHDQALGGGGEEFLPLPVAGLRAALEHVVARARQQLRPVAAARRGHGFQRRQRGAAAAPGH
ncbi:hypothetical protein ADK38_16835, partial [Streptomyces varsoviensis]